MKLLSASLAKRVSTASFVPALLLSSLAAVSAHAQTAPALSFTNQVQHQNQMSSSQGVTSFLGKMFIAFRANDSSHTLWITQSTDGTTFNYPGTQFLNIKIGGAPGLAVISGVMYVVFTANDGTGDIEFMSTNDGINYTPVTNTGIASGSPDVHVATAFGRIYVPFQTPGNKVLGLTTLVGGTSFTSPVFFQNVISGGSPSPGAFGNAVYIAFQSNDPQHTLFIQHSTDGNNFTAPQQYLGIKMGSAPSLAAFNGYLYLAFKSNDSSNILFVTGSADGVNFTSPATGYSAISMDGTNTGPAISVANLPGQTLNGHLILSLEANNPSHDLFTLNTP